MRAVKSVLLVLGLVVIVYSIHRIGPKPILDTLARLAWWQLLVIRLPYAPIMAAQQAAQASADPAGAPVRSPM